MRYDKYLYGGHKVCSVALYRGGFNAQDVAETAQKRQCRKTKLCDAAIDKWQCRLATAGTGNLCCGVIKRRGPRTE